MTKTGSLPWWMWALVVVVIAAAAYGSWHLYRYINWSWGYESQVEDAIRSMVKPECLR